MFLVESFLLNWELLLSLPTLILGENLVSEALGKRQAHSASPKEEAKEHV